MASFPLILAVSPASGFTNARQLVEALRKNLGKYSDASPGIGRPHHLAIELLNDRTKTFVVYVPCCGTALAVQNVIGGKVRALAAMSTQHIAALPDVPTLDEIGCDVRLSGFDVTARQSHFVPKGTPAEIVLCLSTKMNNAINVPEVRARLEDFGLEVVPTDDPALAAFIQRDTWFRHALIKERRLSAE